MITSRHVDNLTLKLAPPFAVEGRVRFTSESNASLEGSALQVMLTNADGITIIPPRSAKVAADGTFHIPDVVPGRYRAIVNGLAPGIYVSSIRADNINALEAPINLTSVGAKVEIVLSDSGAVVSGKVLGKQGKPVARVMVTLWNRRERPGPWNDTRLVSTNDQGDFSIANLAPGDYSIAAWEDGARGLVQIPEFREPIAGRATRVQLQQKSNATVEPVLILREEVEARIATF